MLLLCVIYMAFISLGLPDSLLGAVWPSMRLDLNAPLALAGALSMVCAGGTILSSLLSTRLIRRFRTGPVTLCSVAMTAAALLLYATAPGTPMLFAAAVPLGLGAGSVDAALNNYVALHYEAKHMSWLHCFWGVGATIGPLILSACIGGGLGWRAGYLIVAGIQAALVVALALAQPMWKRADALAAQAEEAASAPMLTNLQALRLPGMKAVLTTFFCYCAAEASMILWTASYAKEQLGVTAERAAFLSSLFFVGITAGRGLNGFLTLKCSSKQLIRLGTALMLLGIGVLFLPLGYPGALVAVALIGLGCAPIYPSTIHETPRRFGAAASQAATGLQMATAYTGSTFMPPLLGLLSGRLTMGMFPYWMLAFTLVMLFGSELVNRQTARRAAA